MVILCDNGPPFGCMIGPPGLGSARVTDIPDDATTPTAPAGASPDVSPNGERNDRFRAAVTAARHIHETPVDLPVIGDVHLPSADELAFLAGIGALAAVGALEWPVALILGAGRLLSHAHRWRSLAAFGEALEHA